MSFLFCGMATQVLVAYCCRPLPQTQLAHGWAHQHLQGGHASAATWTQTRPDETMVLFHLLTVSLLRTCQGHSLPIWSMSAASGEKIR